MTTYAADRPAPADPAQPGPARQRRLRPVLTWLCWVLSVGWALVALARLAGWQAYWWPLVLEPAVVPYAAITAVIPLGLALAARRWLAAGLAAAALVALVGAVAPRAFGGPDPVRGPVVRGPVVRVMNANLREGHADPAALITLARRQRVDLLAIEEVTPDELDRLAVAGLPQLLPFSSANPAGWASGTALFSRYPLTDVGRHPLPFEMVETSATVQVPGASPVQVTVIHYCAPVDPSQTSCWNAGVHSIPPATPQGPARLLLGDFNMTLDYPALREILATGYRDAADVTGDGLAPTFPYLGPPLPKLTIDHVLADHRIGIDSVSVHPVSNSDHRAVFAELTFPASR